MCFPSPLLYEDGMVPAAEEDFEFAALNEAVNYRRALLQEFGPDLKGEVLEVGAGIGQLSEGIVQLAGVTRLDAVEPNPIFVQQLKARGLPVEITEGTVCDLQEDRRYDAIVSVNVLEHIEEDAAELKRYKDRLRPGGRLCLFVPACPSIYAPMDTLFGHHRRYTRTGLGAQLKTAGFAIRRLDFYNSVGYLAWWLNFC